MSQLAEKRCIPCRGGIPPLTAEEIKPLLDQLEGWSVADNHHLRKLVQFPDFKTALNFTNKVGALAEEEDHHPDIYLAWGKVELTLWTHKIDGLTESDFVMAAKVDRIS